MAAKSKRRTPRLAHPGTRSSRRRPFFRRRRWSNYAGNQAVDPVAVSDATSADDLVATVENARAENLTVRAVGSGHSWSDVAKTTGYMVAPEGLRSVERFHVRLARPGLDTSRLVSVGSGTRISEINEWLDQDGLALIQMGGFDGQTIAGVVSTSTHGSGVQYPPFPDYVRSLDLVDGRGVPRRIEPADGPTDPDAFSSERPTWKLTQDDEWFDAVICGMGCMGLIVSLVLEVRDSFELTEVRRERSWQEVKAELLAGEPRRHAHYEVYVNPYAAGGPGSNHCIVTTRNEGKLAGASGHRPLLPELLGKLPWLTAAFVQLVEALAPSRIPSLVDASLKSIRCPNGYANRSYLVYNIGSANNLRAYSAEMELPTEGNRHVEAVERMMQVAERYARDGSIYHTSPVALRFVAPSRALMSMMHERETMTMELIQLVDTDGGVEIMAAHEEALAEFDVRPHWGQINTLSREVPALYPQFPAWERIRRVLDPDNVFASPFSKRVGITADGVTSGVLPAPHGAAATT